MMVWDEVVGVDCLVDLSRLHAKDFHHLTMLPLQ